MPYRRMAGQRHASRCGLPGFSFPPPLLQVRSPTGVPLTPHPVCFVPLPTPSQPLLLLRDTKEHRVLEALMTAPCHWWTRALVSMGSGRGKLYLSYKKCSST